MSTNICTLYEISNDETTSSLMSVAINTTSSYLGDAVLRRSQIRRIVNDQFEDEYEDAEESLMICTENVLKMTSHPLMFAFTAGAGTARYGTAQ